MGDPIPFVVYWLLVTCWTVASAGAYKHTIELHPIRSRTQKVLANNSVTVRVLLQHFFLLLVSVGIVAALSVHVTTFSSFLFISFRLLLTYSCWLYPTFSRCQWLLDRHGQTKLFANNVIYDGSIPALIRKIGSLLTTDIPCVTILRSSMVLTHLPFSLDCFNCFFFVCFFFVSL